MTRAMLTTFLLCALPACGAGTPAAAEAEAPAEPAAPAEQSPPEPEEAPGVEGAEVAEADPEATAEPAPAALEPEELTSAVIQRVVRGRLAEFRHCYEARLVLSPRLAGRVTMELVVGGSGAVVEATIHESTIDDAEVDECVIGVGRSLQFPPPTGGDDVVVRYPFAFGTGS